ncbi:MAG: acyltransferase [Bacteroidales bacterium]|nr:acyltransferase [Bacteroidales bacterium]
MSETKKLSTTYKLLRALGFNYSEEEYGNVSLWRVIKQFCTNIRRKRLANMMDWAILEPFNPRKLRPSIMRKMGCKVGKGCFIGDNVRIDLGHADMITLEDGVSVAGGSRLLCHQRDFSNYCIGDDYNKLGYVVKPIVLKKGCLIGMESFVLPGVTIGEGAIIGAGSLVTKDIPAWTVATGRPAKVVKQIPEKKINYEHSYI